MIIDRLHIPGFLVMILFVSSCNYNSVKKDKTEISDSNTLDSARIDSIIDLKISSLPEFKYLLQFNEKYGNISISILERPKKNFNFYWAQVGRDHPDRLEPIYNFYITPDRFDILYYDTVTDSVITLKEWREKYKSDTK